MKLQTKILLMFLLVLMVLPAPMIMESWNNSLTLQSSQSTELTGTIRAEESGLPLVSGQIVLNDKTIFVEDGHFVINNLPIGRHELLIQGPFREPKKVIIDIAKGTTELDIHLPSTFDQEEISMLARITRAEAEGESLTGQIAVASTVLNRVKSTRYPTSIREVVYQRISGRYQYSPVRDGRIRLAPTQTNYQAAFEALAGKDPSQGATGFYNPRKTRDRWVRSQPVTTSIGGHVFFDY